MAAEDTEREWRVRRESSKNYNRHRDPRTAKNGGFDLVPFRCATSGRGTGSCDSSHRATTGGSEQERVLTVRPGSDLFEPLGVPGPL